MSWYWRKSRKDKIATCRYCYEKFLVKEVKDAKCCPKCCPKCGMSYQYGTDVGRHSREVEKQIKILRVDGFRCIRLDRKPFA